MIQRRPFRRFLRVAGALALIAGSSEPCGASAQRDQIDRDTLASEDSTTAPANRLLPLPIIFYSAETETAFGVTVGYLFRPSGASFEDRPSTVGLQLVYTTKKQIITGVGGELYFSGGRHLLTAGIGYSYFPNTFWGVGNNTPDSAEEDYTPRTFSIETGLRTEVAAGWWLGGGAGFAYRELEKTEEGGLLETGAVPGSEDGWAIRASLSIARDTRENIIYPTAGGNYQFGASLSDRFFGSDYDFTSLSLDLRQYVSVFPSQVFALWGLGIVSTGTHPFDQLPQLGGESLLRGYFAGRYRDRDLMAVQAECRVRAWWRFGVVGFAGAGQVSHELSGLRLDEFWTAAGFGIRFLLFRDEGLNLRADWAFGQNSSGFYLGIGEAF